MSDKMSKAELVSTAKELFHEMNSGVLSTISVDEAGYPFGSITPFSLTHEGSPVILISDLAQHTKNIKADSKCSITVYKQKVGNQQTSARVTLLADAKVISEEERENITTKYLAIFPEAKRYFEAHAFEFYKLVPRRIRFILGFGEIHWLESEEWQSESPSWIDEEQKIIDHMNSDHEDALVNMASHYFDKQADKVELTSLYKEGYYIKIDSETHYQCFKEEILSTNQMRTAFVELARESKP
jgi:putative heme iron utilization protein